MKETNTFLLAMLCFQLILCIIGSILCYVFEVQQDNAWYLGFNKTNSNSDAVFAFFTWFIILSQLLPIGLLVSAELVKAAQTYFMTADINMYDPANDQPVIVRNSTLHEDLGQIEYIFSDKTGTLTQNKMDFRVAFVGITMYGEAESEIAKRLEMRSKGEEFKSGGWTELVKKLDKKEDAEKGFAFGDEERDRMLDVLWGEPGNANKDDDQADWTKDHRTQVRLFLTAHGHQ